MRIPALLLALSFPAAMPAAAAAAAQSAQATPQTIAEELIAADQAFSAAAAGREFVDAVGPMLAEDAVMPSRSGDFSVGRAAIVATLRSYPELAGAKASWAPVRAGLSADGQHGFTYGFMTLSRPDKPDERLKYLAYWVKKPGGWKVAAYKRARSPSGAVSTTLRPPALPARLVAPTTAGIEQHRTSLIAAEKGFSDEAQKLGIGQAFVKNGSSDAMNMGGGADFAFGNDKIGAEVGGPGPAEPGSPVHWAADGGALVASSGDLGVTWGWIRPHKQQAGQPDRTPFFTVWRRDSPQQTWRYIAE